MEQFEILNVDRRCEVILKAVLNYLPTTANDNIRYKQWFEYFRDIYPSDYYFEGRNMDEITMAILNQFKKDFEKPHIKKIIIDTTPLEIVINSYYSPDGTDSLLSVVLKTPFKFCYWHGCTNEEKRKISDQLNLEQTKNDIQTKYFGQG
ncbi:MAG: hypothetical protein PHI35_07990 [Victivallaceae bacterium]|nr:hypothetical protein [Victivallaceae bacterium]